MGDILEVTLENIPDDNLRRYIFGLSKPQKRNIIYNLIPVMNNTMLFAFFGLFVSWKEFRAESSRWEDALGDEQKSVVNAKRVDDVMQSIYCNSILSQETISFIFTETILEALKNPSSPFKQLICGTVATTKIPQIAEIIRVWKINAKKAEDNTSLLKELYLDLINSLSILKYMKIDDADGKIRCRLAVPGRKEIDADLSLFIRKIVTEDTEDLYYLYKVENRRDRMVYLEYMSFGGKLVYKDSLSDEYKLTRKAFTEATCNNLGYVEADNLAKSLKKNDYKYIHRLSLCVSDALRNGTKIDLLEKIKEQGGYWINFKNKEINEINWDNTVVLLMLEFGPSEVIETIIKSDINAFWEILKSMAIRFPLRTKAEIDGIITEREITFKELKEEFEERERKERIYQETMQTELSKNSKVQGWMRNAKICFMSQYIISKVTETETINEAFYAENISMKLQKIISAVERNGAEASLGMINKNLERVFRTLILFYNGVLAYAEARESKLKQYGLEMRHKESVLHEMQKTCEDAFFDSVYKRLTEKREQGKTPIKSASLGKLVEEFKLLCMQMDSTKGNATEYAEKSLLLNSVIGRRQICDISLFEKILKADESDFVGLKNYPTDLVAFFNKVLKHDDPKVEVKDPRIVNNYINYIKDLFIFFDLNDDFKNRGKMSVQNIFDPIFPYVVRYSEKNENRDLCSACQYIINTDGSFEDTKIKLLTEYDYVMNELYYCIPNAECSTENWWVSPFLISCRKFDSMLLELEGEEEK